MPAIVETVDLKKSYAAVEAVRGINLRVPEHSICAFLGQNGAGKSTTLRMLMGMIRPTSGTGRIFGLDIGSERDSVRIRERVAFVAEDKRLYEYMSVAQIVRFTRSFFPRWRDDLEHSLLERFDLPPDRKIRKLSKGMRTKLALLLAFSRGSDFLILDEPTEGLDPVSIEQVLQIIVSLVADGAAVFFSSHQIAEVDQIADHVVMIDCGQIVLDCPMEKVKSEYRHVQAVFPAPMDERDFQLTGIERVYSDGRIVSLIASRNVDAIVEQVRAMQGSNIEVAPLSLKEIFLETVKGRR
jgi:ABC-2 type transport system ATP-binding protein